MKTPQIEKVLRSELYRNLKNLYGHVRIINQGVPFIGTLAASLTNSEKQVRVPTDYGETYVINCPFCNDTRFRLYINHRWGYLDTETNTRNWWLIKCFNEEDCLSTHEKRMELANRIFNEGNLTYGKRRPDRIVECPPQKSGAIKEAILPGKVTPLTKLTGSHPAILYLIERGFNAMEVAEKYQLSYCYESYHEFPLALNRLIIPIFQDEIMVGWQARMLTDPPRRSTPKYFTMTGLKKSEILYNLDCAKKNKHVVLVEGPADVWKVGDDAVASLGCNPSTRQLELLSKNFDKVILLLDGDAQEMATRVFHKLRRQVSVVVNALLQDNADPGNLSTDYLRTIINQVFDEIDHAKCDRFTIYQSFPPQMP